MPRVGVGWVCPDMQLPAGLQDRIRALHRQLLRTARLIYPAPRLVEHLTAGLASKNNRTRVECAELLGELLAKDGLAAFDRAKERPFPALAQARSTSPWSCPGPGAGAVGRHLAGVWSHPCQAPCMQGVQHWAHGMHGPQLVSERDKGIRAAALGTLELLHSAEGGAAAWRAIGSVSDQQRSLIEERFRHSEKLAARAAASRQATVSGAGTSQRTTEDEEVAVPPARRGPAMLQGLRQPAVCPLCKLVHVGSAGAPLPALAR